MDDKNMESLYAKMFYRALVNSLNSSNDAEERHRNRLRFERDFYILDQSLDRKIVLHKEDFFSIARQHSMLSNRLIDLHEKLLKCRKDLRCLQDLLIPQLEMVKKLYLEKVHSKTELYVLERVNTASIIAKKVDACYLKPKMKPVFRRLTWHKRESHSQELVSVVRRWCSETNINQVERENLYPGKTEGKSKTVLHFPSTFSWFI